MKSFHKLGATLNAWPLLVLGAVWRVSSIHGLPHGIWIGIVLLPVIKCTPAWAQIVICKAVHARTVPALTV